MRKRLLSDTQKRYENVNTIVIALLITILGAIFWKAMGFSFGPAYGRGQKWGNKGVQEGILQTKPEEEVMIISGGFYRELWEEEDFKNWVEDAGRGAEVRVVTGPKNESECKDTIREWVEEGIIKLRKLEKPETMHFLIVDKSIAHIEERHIFGKEPERTFFVRNLYPESSAKLYKKFEKLWESGEQISEENIETLFSSPS